jgi:hypothetical protein
MPYKDREAKREWELKHRTERLARRRKLRRIQAAKPTQHTTNLAGIGVLFFPVLASGALAGYNPKLGLVTGGLTLLAATYYRKGWQWWLVGGLTLLLAVLLLKWNQDASKEKEKCD